MRHEAQRFSDVFQVMKYTFQRSRAFSSREQVFTHNFRGFLSGRKVNAVDSVPSVHDYVTCTYSSAQTWTLTPFPFLPGEETSRWRCPEGMCFNTSFAQIFVPHHFTLVSPLNSRWWTNGNRETPYTYMIDSRWWSNGNRETTYIHDQW